MLLPKLGLKLWSTNINEYRKEAIRLYNAGLIDYVELYIVPNSLGYIKNWKTCPFPFIIHGAHSMHKFNLSQTNNKPRNDLLFSQALEYVYELSASKLILHPGVLGTTDNTIKQLNELIKKHNIHPELVFMENKPLITLTHDPCVGSSPEEIKNICEQCHTNFILDVSHAIKYAIGANLDWQEVLMAFMKLKPSILHVCDGNMDNPLDEHLHIDKAQFNFPKIFEICHADFISIETHKDSKENLKDFIEDARRLKEYLN